ncbi:isoprenyl transferase [Corynebacterium sp. CCUG 71335]|uniref:isoprenyl transferase n=1 Tax=unclassified Corynebacterium TaxID=2624378 RepID=UPI00210ECA5C|nr:isoprenyl transferase [Corynebacterium sp. CCUG 71335]MCQ4627743.1 isoprenyl transferase [Corynebacterium sp. CCUG 65737]
MTQNAIPDIPAELIPRHIALVMDGNGRWAQERGMPRTEGHRVGEKVLMDMVDACIEMGGVEWLSAYTFSTENWRRSREEVRFLMGFSREVMRAERDQLHAKNVRIVWVGRRPRLWRSVIRELEAAEEMTKNNTGLTLAMCINYGGRAELIDATRTIAQLASEGKLAPGEISEETLAGFMYRPDMPDVDMFLRPSGEQRTSNFLLWQSAYAEMVYRDILFPDFTKEDLYDAVLEYAKRDRRFGGTK